MLSDTVGFIRELPHTLVAAFRATLEETIQADLLLHVVDASEPDARRPDRRGEQGARRDRRGAMPQLLVWNKIDLTGVGCPPESTATSVVTSRAFE